MKLVEQLSHLQAGDAQFEQGHYVAAADSYQQAYQEAQRTGKSGKVLYRKLIRASARANIFNPRVYFANDRLKIIYCRIPKNACTIFTNMMIENSAIADRFLTSPLGPHNYLSKHSKALRITDSWVFKDPDYFKFVVLRNPFKRLVSGYLDKFAKTTVFEKMAKTVILSVQAEMGTELNLEKSITFEQFIEYLVKTEDSALDAHWRPQNTFLSQGLFEFDLVGQFERLDNTITDLESRFKITITQDVMKKAKRGHATKYTDVPLPNNLHSILPQELRQLSGFPKASQLLTPRLRSLIERRYEEDIATYARYFGSAEI